MEAKKQVCDTLQGLFDTLLAKFWPQFNEMIKLLQFRKLCRIEDESTEEWMGHLPMAAAECGYKEIDRQLKEQFIHGLNDKIILNEIIRELKSKTSSQQMTSEDVLAWAKRVKVQRVQASILNDITETKTFDKIKKEPESKNTWGRQSNIMTHQIWQGTAEVCEMLCKLTSSKTMWTWNASYQQLFSNAKSIIKADVCMKFYDDSKHFI